MNIVLFILCVLSFLLGVAIFGSAKSAIHEIEGSILLLISAVLLVGACTISSINKLHGVVGTSNPENEKEK